jgi:low molecular weight protein-tyrosine phosphatase
MKPGQPPAASLPQAREPGRPYRVCLVCMGNICRSPMAESVVRAEVERAGIGALVEVDSAGIGDWHKGERMDPRASAELARRGYLSSAHRARQIGPSWLRERDLVLAMDQQNLRALVRMARGADAGDADAGGRIRLLRSLDPGSPDGAEVPDPYYAAEGSFAHVLALIEAAAKELAGRLAELLAPPRTGTRT